eukprot:825749-Rhodomonas_salina.1
MVAPLASACSSVSRTMHPAPIVPARKISQYNPPTRTKSQYNSCKTSVPYVHTLSTTPATRTQSQYNSARVCTGALAHDEAVALLVEGARGAERVVVARGDHRPHRCEPGGSQQIGLIGGFSDKVTNYWIVEVAINWLIRQEVPVIIARIAANLRCKQVG